MALGRIILIIICLIILALLIFLSSPGSKLPLKKERHEKRKIPTKPIGAYISKTSHVKQKPAQLSLKQLLEMLVDAYNKGEEALFDRLLVRLSKRGENELKKILYKGGLKGYLCAMALAKMATKNSIYTLLEIIIRKDMPEGLEPDQWIQIKTAAQGAFMEGIDSDNAISILKEIAKNHQNPLARTISTTKLFDLDPSTSILVDQIYYDTDPGVRINSATLLSRYQDTQKATSTLRFALLYDPHRGVRSQAAISLGEIQTPEAKEALHRGLEIEKDPTVLKSIQSALQMFE
jgi:hypothetical protein